MVSALYIKLLGLVLYNFWALLKLKELFDWELD